MKDYYYILGLKQNSTAEEVKSAYRKLSLKFHPDKNNGDEFFTERFKEIQEAYEILSNDSKRSRYDELKNRNSSNKESGNNQKNSGFNFNPEIEYFRSNKQEFEFDEEITFSWKTINSDRVFLKPFGVVQSIGQKTYKIKDYKNSQISFELVAENSNIGRRVNSLLILRNKTYSYLYEHFKEKFKQEEQIKNESKNNSSNNNFDINSNVDVKDGTLSRLIMFNLFIILGLILFIYFNR